MNRTVIIILSLFAVLCLLSPSQAFAGCFDHLHNFDDIQAVAKDPDTSTECLQQFMGMTWTKKDVDTEDISLAGGQLNAKFKQKTIDSTDTLLEQVYLTVASHPNASTKQLSFLSKSIWRDVRLAVASNTNTPNDIILHLAKSNNSDISAAAQFQLDSRKAMREAKEQNRLLKIESDKQAKHNAKIQSIKDEFQKWMIDNDKEYNFDSASSYIDFETLTKDGFSDAYATAADLITAKIKSDADIAHANALQAIRDKEQTELDAKRWQKHSDRQSAMAWAVISSMVATAWVADKYNMDQMHLYDAKNYKPLLYSNNAITGSDQLSPEQVGCIFGTILAIPTTLTIKYTF